MITAISYKDCRCDFCGKAEKIESGYSRPSTWFKLEFRGETYDYCFDCGLKLSQLLNEKRDDSSLIGDKNNE